MVGVQPARVAMGKVGRIQPIDPRLGSPQLQGRRLTLIIKTVPLYLRGLIFGEPILEGRIRFLWSKRTCDLSMTTKLGKAVIKLRIAKHNTSLVEPGFHPGVDRAKYRPPAWHWQD